jgi:hypothetical protein
MKKYQLLSSRWKSESTTPWRANGYQSSEAGWKGGQFRARRNHTVEQVAKSNESEGIAEAPLRTTGQRWLMGRPKRERFQTTY